MSFIEPLAITISGVANTLPRISDVENGDGSIYSNGDGSLVLTASHVRGKSAGVPGKGTRTRRLIRLDATKTSADPHKPAENVQVSMSNYIVWDLPPAGYNPAEALAVWKGFAVFLFAASDQAVIKLLGGES